MVVTVRFRPIILGLPHNPVAVLYLVEDGAGKAWFRELEFALPLAVRLEEATLSDLPADFQVKGVTILPVQEARSATEDGASDRMMDMLDAIATKGATALGAHQRS